MVFAIEKYLQFCEDTLGDTLCNLVVDCDGGNELTSIIPEFMTLSSYVGSKLSQVYKNIFVNVYIWRTNSMVNLVWQSFKYLFDKNIRKKVFFVGTNKLLAELGPEAVFEQYGGSLAMSDAIRENVFDEFHFPKMIRIDHVKKLYMEWMREIRIGPKCTTNALYEPSNGQGSVYT